MKEDFCARLKELRGRVSQVVFADNIGVKQTTYSAWEKGRSEPPIDKICEISAKFMVSADWLLGLPERGGGNHATANGDHAIANAGGNLTIAGRAETTCDNCPYKRLGDAFKRLPEMFCPSEN